MDLSSFFVWSLCAWSVIVSLDYELAYSVGNPFAVYRLKYVDTFWYRGYVYVLACIWAGADNPALERFYGNDISIEHISFAWQGEL